MSSLKRILKSNTSTSTSPSKKKLDPSILNSFWITSNFSSDSLKVLGAGGFGMVFSAENIKLKKTMAVKSLKVTPEDDIISMMQEVSTLSQMRDCPNIIKIFDIFLDSASRQVLFSMEMADGSLEDLINSKGRLDLDLILQVLADCLNGLIFASGKDYAHLDINPRNILYFKIGNRNNKKDLQTDFVKDPNLVFKLSDWGGSLRGANKTRFVTSAFPFSVGYVAPEALNDDIEELNLGKMDMYSLGMTLLSCSGLPFKMWKHLSTMPSAKKFAAELEEVILNLDDCFSPLKPIISQIVCFDGAKRLSCQEAYKLLKSQFLGEENDVKSSKIGKKNPEQKKAYNEDDYISCGIKDNKILNTSPKKEPSWKISKKRQPSTREQTYNEDVDGISCGIKEKKILNTSPKKEFSEKISETSKKKQVSLNEQKINEIHNYLQMYYKKLFLADELKKHFLENVKTIFEEAQKNNSLAHFLLGRVYDSGDGVPVNLKEAIKWYKKAADLGQNADAMCNLGILYTDEKSPYYDPTEGVTYYQAGIDLGNERCMRNLGIYYKESQMGAQAFELYSKLERKGNPIGSSILAWCYECGFGCEKNLTKAFNYLYSARNELEPEEKCAFACYYLNGKGIEKNEKEGIKWMEIAANEGSGFANKEIGKAYYCGWWGYEKDLNLATVYWKKAAEKDDAEAQFNLGILAEESNNLQEAEKWYIMSANQGYEAAIINLCRTYLRKNQFQEALPFVLKGVEKSIPISLMDMGKMYIYGHGVQKNIGKAKEFLNKVIQVGDQELKNEARCLLRTIN